MKDEIGQYDACALTIDEEKEESQPQPATAASGVWRVLWIIYFVMFTDSMSMFVVTPLIGSQATSRWHVDPKHSGMVSGLVLSAYPLSGFVSSLWMGHLGDVYGRKKMMMIGLASGALCMTLFALSTGFEWGLLCFLVAGFFNSNYTHVMAICSDVTEKGQLRNLAFGYMGACLSLSRLVSSAICLLSETSVFFILDPDNPYLLPCVIVSAVHVICLPVVFFCLPDTRRRAISSEVIPSACTVVRLIFRDGVFLKLVFSFALGSLATSAILAVMALFFSLPLVDSGMALTSMEVSLAYCWFSLYGFVFQMALLRPAIAQMSIFAIYLASGTLLTGSALMIAVPPTLFGHTLMFGDQVKYLAMRACLVVTLVLFSIGITCCPSAISAMQSNSLLCESRSGLMMGFNHSLASLCR